MTNEYQQETDLNAINQLDTVIASQWDQLSADQLSADQLQQQLTILTQRLHYVGNIINNGNIQYVPLYHSITEGIDRLNQMIAENPIKRTKPKQ